MSVENDKVVPSEIAEENTMNQTKHVPELTSTNDSKGSNENYASLVEQSFLGLQDSDPTNEPVDGDIAEQPTTSDDSQPPVPELDVEITETDLINDRPDSESQNDNDDDKQLDRKSDVEIAEPEFISDVPTAEDSTIETDHTEGLEVMPEHIYQADHNRAEVVRIENITKTYQMGDFELQVLKGIDLTIREGEFVSIMGPSGSGKSTLMNILGLLDEPTSGEYYLDDSDASTLSEAQRAVLRNQKIGFVFQSFNLLKRTTALHQVELPLIYGSKSKRAQLAKESLEAVGLGQRLDHTPAELSGGQQQRVAIARALVTQPSLILADEPTGNLDSKSGVEVMQIFQRLNREENKTTIFVTHDSWIARHTDRVIMLRDGKVIADQKIDEPLVAGESERPSGAGQLQGIFDATYYGGDESEYN